MGGVVVGWGGTFCCFSLEILKFSDSKGRSCRRGVGVGGSKAALRAGCRVVTSLELGGATAVEKVKTAPTSGMFIFCG